MEKVQTNVIIIGITRLITILMDGLLVNIGKWKIMCMEVCYL